MLPALLLVFALSLSFASAGNRDRDVQGGQVPLKDSPVTFLDDVNIGVLDLTKDKGCVGRRCRGDHRRKSGGGIVRWAPSERRSEEPEERSYESRCDLPLDAGECDGRLTRFYFNRRSRSCQRFEYSGCRGNGNNFRTRRGCEMECGGGGAYEYDDHDGGYEHEQYSDYDRD